MRYAANKSRKRRWSGIGRIFCLLGGCLLLAYPWISELHNERTAAAQIRVCETAVKEMDETDRKKQLQDAMAYNRSLVTQHVAAEDPFEGRKDQKADGQYEKLLFTEAQGMMGYLEIPCISLRLPVYHGTSAEVLEKGIGHLQGSSLPVGGKGTHAVLTGHTGLERARLFTDLIQMKEGDLFFLHVLDRILTYRVEQVWTVLPEDTEKLQIEKQEDLVTLVTCTPYGINDHRLLVRGKRVSDAGKDSGQKKNGHKKTASVWKASYAKACKAGLGLLVLIKISGNSVRAMINRKKKRKKHHEK